ncbi:hypothetical protein BN159_1543 [Streptomyces davaonensis JCM 4913]|uniref:Uncharacterized protein n=1 Tax=Streptomyces davaonensis (strain DSM 101723 / JCM 4913 / KCC S-0913 / 768) TaxID=1214101 RepID=K4QYC1_STRDJ|nr:hypothetical protein [Streptomyces davaonensis]CCK25922.1 hypothetical protein BN159_1543 [Streptomyces davaonensis JCM 4913]
MIVVDDYSNSSPQVFARVERIAGRFVGAVHDLDIRDRHAVSAVFPTGTPWTPYCTSRA